MIDFVSVGKKIAKLRNLNNMTQDELAEKLFVTRQALSKWENGNSVPSINVLLDLSKIFNTTFEDILCLDDEVDINQDNIFKGHSRTYIINKIIKNEIFVDIPSVFYLFSPSERMQVLKAIKEGKIDVNKGELSVRLTPGEQRYLNKGE